MNQHFNTHFNTIDWSRSLLCFLNSYLCFQLHWLDADILCLQEVDSFYFPYLVNELGNRGYQGIFKDHNEGMQSHGLAMFYKTKKFTMKESNTYGFNDMLGKMCDLNQFKDSNQHNQRFAQYTTLEERQTGKQMAIGLFCCI